MKRKTSNSPYPVLYPAGEEYAAEQGYRQAHFDVAGEPRLSVNEAHNLVIDFDFDLAEERLSSLVTSGAAKYYVNVECGHTYFRHAYVQSEKSFHLEIGYGDIADSIEIFVGLVADWDIPAFSASAFVPRYGAATFDIEKGDILAVGTGWTVELEGLDGSVDPYIYVNRDLGERNSELWVNGTGDKLVVNLASDLYDIYFTRKKTRKAELVALVMKPAILSALQSEIVKAQANGGDEAQVDVTGRRWLRKLDGLIGRVLDEEGVDWDVNKARVDGDRGSDTLAYAVGALLKRPLAKAMEEINKKKGGV